jgi:uncharacterized protein YbjT (DUF2867 family)
MSAPDAAALVTGGTGTLGRHLVSQLQDAGATLRVLSRKRRPEQASIQHVTGDLRTGAGLAAALDGATVILHCATAARGEVAMTQRLVDAARELPTRPHLVYVSIVGIDRIPLGYYKAKLAAEHVVIRSGLPYTIQRSTQFHELWMRIFAAQRFLPVVVAPARSRFQPIAAVEVAARLAELARGEPAGRVPDIGGPEVVAAGELARSYLRLVGRRRAVLPAPVPGAVGRAWRAGHQLTPNAVGRIRFQDQKP